MTRSPLMMSWRAGSLVLNSELAMWKETSIKPEKALHLNSVIIIHSLCALQSTLTYTVYCDNHNKAMRKNNVFTHT